MEFLEEAKDNIAQIMTDYRYKIEELERDEYFAVDYKAIETLKKIPLNTELTYNGQYCKFIEIVPSKKIFRIFIDSVVKELDVIEIINLTKW